MLQQSCLCLSLSLSRLTSQAIPFCTKKLASRAVCINNHRILNCSKSFWSWSNSSLSQTQFIPLFTDSYPLTYILSSWKDCLVPRVNPPRPSVPPSLFPSAHQTHHSLKQMAKVSRWARPRCIDVQHWDLREMTQYPLPSTPRSAPSFHIERLLPPRLSSSMPRSQ